MEWKIVAEFADAESGAKSERTRFQAMMDHGEKLSVRQVAKKLGSSPTTIHRVLTA
jgi:IS30 family transposase